MWGLDDKVGIERLARRYARLSLAFTAAFVAALVVLGDMIVKFLFGQDYADAAMIAVVLLWYLPFCTGTNETALKYRDIVAHIAT